MVCVMSAAIDQAYIRGILKETDCKGKMHTKKFRLRCKDGSERWVRGFTTKLKRGGYSGQFFCIADELLLEAKKLECAKQEAYLPARIVDGWMDGWMGRL